MSGNNIQVFVQIGFTLLLIVFSLMAVSIGNSWLSKFGKTQEMMEKKTAYLRKLFGFSVFILLCFCVILVWGIDFKGVFVFASSLFAVVGIALFASWSILSNITSSLLLFFSFPYKIGDRIKVLDGENSVEGRIIDITLFSLQIRDDKDNVVLYPNNLVMQKPVINLKPDPKSV